MSEAARRIGELVMRIQRHFIERPGLTLTRAQVRTRLGLDDVTCHAVLDALADARVLARTRDGGYVRPAPRPARRSVEVAAVGQRRRRTVTRVSGLL